MKRSTKNLLAIFILILLILSCIFTIKYTKTTITSNSKNNMIKNEIPSGTPPSSGPGESENNSGTMTTPPEKPDSDNNTSKTTPPSMPNENSTTDSSTDNNTSSSMPQPPTSNNDQTEPSGNMPPTNTQTSNLNILSYILFGLENIGIAGIILYLIMSNFNKKELKETLKNNDKVTIYILATIIIASGLTLADVYTTNKLSANNSQTKTQTSANITSSQASGATTIDGEEKTLTDTYETNTSDESAIVVKNKGNATITGATINKTGGESSNTENSEFYGINAGILVTENSTATIKKSTITTNAKGSNAVFATGTDAKIYISNSTIKTTASSSSRGLDATYGGHIEADNIDITTKGGSCATLATDRGEGTIITKNSKLETNGAGSPLIYSTGNISISNTTGIANNSQLVVIEGKNSATVEDSQIEASGKGNRNDVDNAGIMIYQSMSGDASEGTGTFTSKNSTLTIDKNSSYYTKVPMFFITNTDAVINLENTKLEYGSNTLISEKGTSEWGTSGSNGGNLTLNATNQTLTGNIEIDKISTLDLNLSSSNYKGTINKDNTAKNIKVTLDKSSKLILTSDSYITELNNEDTTYSNIDFNGYKLYVNGKAIN